MNTVYIKKMLFPLAGILILLFIPGCSLNNNTQLSFDTMNYLYYTLTDTATQKSIDFIPTQANETKGAMAIAHMLSTFNSEDNTSVSLDDPNTATFEHSYILTAYDEEAHTYSFTLSFNQDGNDLFLSYDNRTVIYPQELLINLLKNGIFEEFDAIKDTPSVELRYNKTSLDYLSTTSFAHTYFGLYTQEIASGTSPSNEDIDSLNPIDIVSDVKNFVLVNVANDAPIDTSPIPDWELSDIAVDYKDSGGKTLAHTKDLALPDLAYGTYEAICKLTFEHQNSDAQYVQTLYYKIHYDSEESFTFNNDVYQPGDLAVLIGSNLSKDLSYTVDTTIYHQGLSFVHEEDSSYLLLPLMSRTTPDDYTFTITVADGDTPIKSYDFVIHVTDKAFEVQHLTTSSGVASVRNEENYAIMNADFKHGRSDGSPTKQWDGAFIQPVGGRISTEYGVIRYTNGSTESSRHSGIDFANPEGTPVVATQNGYIRLAKENPVTGMTIFIDHGAGIYSQYYHLSSMAVEEGDYVEKGSVIGAIGTTGFSTGPHLHFSIYNNGIYLNPWKFFDKAPY